MNITKVVVNLYESGHTKGFATINIDNDFVVTGLKILNGANGFWVAMPNRKDKNNEYKDIAYPVTQQARKQIEHSVLTEYHKLAETNHEPSIEVPEKSNEQKRYDSIEIDTDLLPF